MSIEQREIDTDRGRFAVRTAGSPADPLVLCLHGFPDDASTFDDLSGQLVAAGFRTAAPFCRGYAPSPLRNPNGGDFGNDLFSVLAADALAIAEALSPAAPVHLVGHDNGAFTTYHVLAKAPERIGRAVTLAAGHPAAVFPNTSRSPAQMWRSRYAFFFLVPRLPDWFVRRHDWAYIERLWGRWSPGWTPPPAHLGAVKRTLNASWPAPLGHYRSGAFKAGEWRPLTKPMLYLAGADDGCVSPTIADGQERWFAGGFSSRVIPDAGHFLHLEQLDVVADAVIAWLKASSPPH